MRFLVLACFLIILCINSTEADSQSIPRPQGSIFGIYIPNLHTLNEKYLESGLYHCLHEEEMQRFIDPALQQFKSIVSFWENHLKLDRDIFFAIVKDTLRVDILHDVSLQQGRSESTASNTMSILSFRYNKETLDSWLKKYLEGLPAGAKKTTRSGDIQYTSLHYYIALPATDDDSRSQSSEKNESLYLPGLMREREINIHYGQHGNYFFIAYGKPQTVARIFSHKDVRDRIFAQASQTNLNEPDIYINSDINSLLRNNQVGGNYFGALPALFGVHRLEGSCNLLPDSLRMEISVDHASLGTSTLKTRVLPQQLPVPKDADYFMAASIPWDEAWEWFHEHITKFSDSFARYERSVWTNYNNQAASPLDRVFQQGLGNTITLFPVTLSSLGSNTPVRQTVVFLETRDTKIMLDFLRIALRIVSQITRFTLSEKNTNGATQLLFKESTSPSGSSRQILFYCDEKRILITGSYETVASYDKDEDAVMIPIEKIPNLATSAGTPVFIFHQDVFNPAPLLRQIKQTAETIRVPLDQFNNKVFNLAYPPSSRVFTTYFGSANLYIVQQRDDTKIHMKIDYQRE